MQLTTTTITAISIDLDNYENHKVEFSCYDDDASGVISFNDSINFAHACFLYEYDMVDMGNAYGQMIKKIVTEGLEGLTVGEKFESGQDEE